MADYTHAIKQLRWLIKEDFIDRRNSEWSDDQGTHKFWWQSQMGRTDIAKLRSYIHGVRLMERLVRELVSRAPTQLAFITLNGHLYEISHPEHATFRPGTGLTSGPSPAMLDARIRPKRGEDARQIQQFSEGIMGVTMFDGTTWMVANAIHTKSPLIMGDGTVVVGIGGHKGVMA